VSSGVEERAEGPGHLVLARAKAAIAQGDQAGALALLHVLFTEGVEAAATLTPVLAEALIATARMQADEHDRQARQAYARGQAVRAEICRLLRTAPLDQEDLQAIRQMLEERERELKAEAEQRVAEQRQEVGSAPETRRLGVGWLERYWVERRWGPYLRVRWREGSRKRMKYIGKVPTP
jgi:DNA polymerase III gamma/tau subunit